MFSMRGRTRAVGTVFNQYLTRHASTKAGIRAGQRMVGSLAATDARQDSGIPGSLQSVSPQAAPFDQQLPLDRPKIAMVNVAAEDSGQTVAVEFADTSVFKFTSSWLRDSSTDLVNESYIRASAWDVQRCEGESVASVERLDGSMMKVSFSDGMDLTYRGDWLRAFSPFSAEQVRGPEFAGLQLQKAHLVDELFHNDRNLWESDFQAVHVDAESLLDSNRESRAKRKVVLEALCRDGAVVIRNMEKPSSLDQSVVGKPMERVAKALAGKLYQHPTRATNHGIMRKKMVTATHSHLTDYNLSVALAMHNDHAFISDANSGYWQLLHQANGCAKAKLVNAAAVAAELKRVDPAGYKLLTEVNVTHALRTLHYDANGKYTAIEGDHDGVFEDESTHPILNLKTAATGEVYLEKVSHQEIKRGVCAVPYDKQDGFLAAYRKWIEMIESDRFVAYVDWPQDSMLIVNNHWVMHGRGIPQSADERVMVWGYMQKHIVDLSYRLLRQRELKAAYDVPGHCSSRIPNQVLAQLIRLYSPESDAQSRDIAEGSFAGNLNVE
jgi:alpha-ketoglutarate-dependent taurine dioxygenase